MSRSESSILRELAERASPPFASAPERHAWSVTTALLGVATVAVLVLSRTHYPDHAAFERYVFIPVYGTFLLMAGPLVTGRLDRPLTGVVLAATVVGVVGDLADGTANDGWMRHVGLAIAAAGCVVAAMTGPTKRWGLAFGGAKQVLATAAAWLAPSRYLAGLPGTVVGFWIGLAIDAIKQGLAALKLRRSIGAIAIMAAGVAPAAAQELEARAYSPAPIGTKIIVGGVGGSKGGILFDPLLDVDDVHGDLTLAITGLGYTFDVAGRQARVLAVFPIAWGAIDGSIGSTPQRQELRGLVDPRIKFTIGLRGMPALTRAEFARARRQTMVGASVTVMPPLGDYHANRLVNLGYNRWAIKPEIGVTRSIGPWTVEGAAGVWVFTTNTRYAPGFARKTQDPIGSLQGHVSYAWPNRVWVAFDATWFEGGQTRVDGLESPDLQRNSRLGGTLSIPTFKNHSLKVTYSTGATTRRGTDFDTVNVTWQAVVF